MQRSAAPSATRDFRMIAPSGIRCADTLGKANSDDT
jgi:hypothetical protein